MLYLKKNRRKVIVILIGTAISFTLTPVAFQYAQEWRGYEAIGGEIFVPIIPFLIYLIVKELYKIFILLLAELERGDVMKCYMCEEEFTDEEIEEMREMGENFCRESNYFICPDCYDDYHRLVLEDQFTKTMKGR